jgi:hypothetical protein
MFRMAFQMKSKLIKIITAIIVDAGGGEFLFPQKWDRKFESCSGLEGVFIFSCGCSDLAMGQILVQEECPGVKRI